jgi:hypothetical protein
MHLHLLEPLIENAYAAAVPTHPNLAPNIFGRHFVIGARDFHVTIAMHGAARFLVAGKNHRRQRLQMRAFFSEADEDLLARGAVNASISHVLFPLRQMQVLRTE